MARPSRRPEHPLTRGQKEQLLQLLRVGAVSRDTAKGPYAPGMGGCNPMIIGALRDKGLADSRTVRPGASGNPMGGQFTAYWLTKSGLEQARLVETEEAR